MESHARYTVALLFLAVLCFLAFLVAREQGGGQEQPEVDTVSSQELTAGKPVAVESAEKKAVPPVLVGAVWQLVEFQSMDDSVGKIQPEDPERFTLQFFADGRVAMQLDCNRGTGSWSHTPADDGQSGQLQFGPMAVTRMLCPGPPLGERLARDTSFIRSFLLKDDKLYLSLKADAGIYSWQRQQSP